MAAIDKIYINSIQEWLEFRTWCRRVRMKCWRETGYDILYGWYWYQQTPAQVHEYIDYAKGKDFPMCNMPRQIDYWLMKRCPIEWIQNTLEYQYGESTVKKKRRKGKYFIG